MNGWVNEQLEPILPIILFGAAGEAFEIEALIDTGSTAELTLPREIIDELELSQADEESATLADGQSVICKTFIGRIVWHSIERQIQVVELDMVPLIGMKLLEGSQLSIDAWTNGAVVVVANEHV